LKFEEDWGEYFYHEERILKRFEKFSILLMKKENFYFEEKSF